MKEKRPKIETLSDALNHIYRLAEDKQHRLLLADDCVWQERKLKEILRLVKLAKKLSNKEAE